MKGLVSPFCKPFKRVLEGEGGKRWEARKVEEREKAKNVLV